jgi:putative endopeptidase
MSNLVCRRAVLALLIAAAQNLPAVAQSASADPPATGNFGFDLAGADFASRPGDDFFRHGNGTWYDHAVIDWWTDADAEEFNARAAVLGRQFDSYEPVPGVHLKGDLTMGENIADLGGALVALDGYHQSLHGKPAPVIDGLTGDQRFYLGYAQSWRQKQTDDSLRQQIVSNPHAPVQYRVNGVVRNMGDWYGAFDVKPGDKLYLAPQDRARIW